MLGHWINKQPLSGETGIWNEWKGNQDSVSEETEFRFPGYCPQK